MEVQLRREAFLISCLLLLASHAATAQSVPVLTDSSSISIITILPGDHLYSMYGHSAIRVQDPALDLDLLFNYGTFRFELPGFLVTFLSGRLDYRLGVSRFRRDFAHYRRNEKRPIVEQRLRLGRTQRQSVFSFLSNNALPENATYRYDFLFDNCSTRVLDAFELVLGDSVDFEPPEMPQRSFRDLIHLYSRPYSFTTLGIDILLGQTTDQIASAREAVFLPDLLADAFDAATVKRNDRLLPLVVDRDTLYWIQGYGHRRSVPWASILTWTLAGIGVLITVRDRRQNRSPGRWLDVTWLAFTGVAGCFLALMWVGTEHHVTRANLDLAWAFPAHVIPAFLLWRGRRPAWLPAYMGGTAAVMFLLLLGWPLWPEPLNNALIPIVLTMAIRSATYARRHWNDVSSA